nr:collagen alpha-1(I) chain-like [Odocoileus virginianus texanus]
MARSRLLGALTAPAEGLADRRWNVAVLGLCLQDAGWTGHPAPLDASGEDGTCPQGHSTRGHRGFHLALLGEPSSRVPLGLPLSQGAEPVGEPCLTLGGCPPESGRPVTVVSIPRVTVVSIPRVTVVSIPQSDRGVHPRVTVVSIPRVTVVSIPESRPPPALQALDFAHGPISGQVFVQGWGWRGRDLGFSACCARPRALRSARGPEPVGERGSVSRPPRAAGVALRASPRAPTLRLQEKLSPVPLRRRQAEWPRALHLGAPAPPHEPPPRPEPPVLSRRRAVFLPCLDPGIRAALWRFSPTSTGPQKQGGPVLLPASTGPQNWAGPVASLLPPLGLGGEARVVRPLRLWCLLGSSGWERELSGPEGLVQTGPGRSALSAASLRRRTPPPRPSVPPDPQEPQSGCRPQGQAPGWERAYTGPAVDGGLGKDATQPTHTAHTRPEMGRVESLGVSGCGHPRPAYDVAKEPSCRAHGFRSPRPDLPAGRGLHSCVSGSLRRPEEQVGQAPPRKPGRRERTGRSGKLPASSGRPGPSTVPGGAGPLTHHPLKSPGGRQGHVSRGETGGTTQPAVSETRKKETAEDKTADREALGPCQEEGEPGASECRRPATRPPRGWARVPAAGPPECAPPESHCRDLQRREGSRDSGATGRRPENTQVRSPPCMLGQNKFQMGQFEAETSKGRPESESSAARPPCAQAPGAPSEPAVLPI